MTTYFGYYSELAAEKFGTVFYNTPQNTLVEVTAVFSPGAETMYNWKDKVYVGEVTTYAKKVE